MSILRQYDSLLIQGGRVVDPVNQVDDVQDILIRDGKIDAIGKLNEQHKNTKNKRRFNILIAEIEKLDGSYEDREMGDPICCEDYCDTCGDCLACYPHSPGEECATGGRWVIYIENRKNPFHYLKE